MKKIFLSAMMIMAASLANAQGPIAGILNRYTDPEKGQVTFIEKGNRAFGISGSFRSFNASGTTGSDGYSILSMLNIGDGSAKLWSVAPGFSWFVADDLSIGINVNYSGYLIDTNLKLDFRDVINSDDEILNVQISNRHMHRHAAGLALTGRKYMSFFGSKTVGVFGEARLYGKLAWLESYPIPKEGEEAKRLRYTNSYDLGLKVAGGLAVRLRDNSAITISVPILGVVWQLSNQRKYDTIKDAEDHDYMAERGGKLSSLSVARDVDMMGVQFGYVRYIEPKKR